MADGTSSKSHFGRDYTYGGSYRIRGTVDELGVVGRYQVALFDRATRLPAQYTTSGADGSYVFNNIAYVLKGYYVIAFDHGANPLNAAIADYVTPELMP